MIISLIMIILSVSILYLVTPWTKVIGRLWFALGSRLFQYTVFHDDSVNGEVYGFTFTNDDLWQDKMLRDLQKPAVTINETEDE